MASTALKTPSRKPTSATPAAGKTSTNSATKKTPKSTTAKGPKVTRAPSRTLKQVSEDRKRNGAVKPNEIELDEIWRVYKKTGDQNLRDILLETHMPLVRMIAERLLQTLPKSIELDDLQSAGVFGLMDAIDGFDLSRGIKFKTYCTTRIRGSILDELRSQDWVPRLVRLKAHKLDKATRKLEGELGRMPNQMELASEMELSLEELTSTAQEANARAMFSLSEKWDDGDDDKDMEKVEILADKNSDDPADQIDQRDVFETITRNLTKRERLIIIMYYHEGLTMREIGEIMELTESRVCQIHTNVMARLKAQLDQTNLHA